MMELITSSLIALQRLYKFEAGEDCPGDDFLPMIIYVLLQTGLVELFALHDYLRHFLEDCNQNVEFFSSMENYVYSAFCSAVGIIKKSIPSE